MSDSVRDGILSRALRFFSRFRLPQGRVRLLFLLVPAVVVLIEFFALGLARRTFVFYAVNSGLATVEDRLLRKSPSREINITRYVEEALLGPFSQDVLLLFPQDARLQSLLLRDGVVYADLSIEAALPPLEGGGGQKNFETLHSGIRRNFPFVRDVRFFIDGKAAYADNAVSAHGYREGAGASGSGEF